MAEASQIKCPNCGQAYFVQPEQWAQYAGQTINCTRCGREFTVTGATQSAPAAPPPAYQQPPRPVQNRPMQGAPMNVGPTSPFAPQPPIMGYSGAPIPTSGWAIASLITGIAGFCVPLICSVFAIVAGFVGLSQVKQGRATGRGLAISGIILGFISLSFWSLVVLGSLLPAVSQARGTANRIKCANNMRQIGLAIIMYSSQHNSQFPGQLSNVMNDSGAPVPQTFVCPDDAKTPPAKDSNQQTIADLNSGNHCSYIYLGRGVQSSAITDATTVLMYEDFALQRRNKVNVLFADGHVGAELVATVQSAIRAASGKGPVIIADSAQ